MTVFRHESRKLPHGLADLLLPFALIDDGILLQQDGSLLTGWSYRGPDMLSASTAEMEALSARLNSALRLGTGWIVECDAIRSGAPGYPERGSFPDPVTRVIDDERRQQFMQEGAHFESEYFLTLTYLPPLAAEERLKGWLYEGREHSTGRAAQAALEHFRAKVDAFENVFGALFHTERLTHIVDDSGFTFDALLRYLHRAITGIEHIDKVVQIDQAPIGRTPRSNPATYTGVFAPIRELYAMLPESRERGYRPGRFSFNVKGGRCEACQGDGQRRIEMNFLPDVYVTCEVCRGKRYNAETLAVRYKGLSISDLLDLPIEEALKVLENIPAIQIKLQTLVDVGLGYVQLGQSATTISGGEAQRTKLARELSKRQTGRTLYILDEPTTGLHFDDVKKLLDVLNRLVTLGNTVLIIEHNLDVIKQADWIIDLGPEGGEEGGRIVAQGSPEQVARVKKSYTGQILSRALNGNGTSSNGADGGNKKSPTEQ